jgi:hypothetical protein
MKKIFIFLVIIFVTTISVLNAQTITSSINVCHDKSKKIKYFNWLDYSMEFEMTNLSHFYTNDSSVQYNVSTKIIKLATIDGDTLSIQLKSNGVELQMLKNDSSLFMPISNDSAICYNNNEDLFLRLNHIGGIGILPIITNRCKFTGLIFPVIHNKHINLFFFTSLETKQLCWDIIVSGFEDQVKIFTSDNGQIESINLCYKNGVPANYKVVDPGIEIFYTQKKANNTLWKIRKVVETEYKGLFAYEDLIEYKKNGEVKSSKIKIKECN